MNENQIERALATEVRAVHDFIAAWFNGRVEQSSTAFARGLGDRLAGEFINIQPSGRLLTRDELLGGIADGYGCNKDFRIEISGPRLRWLDDRNRMALMTYVEHQYGARNTDPPDNDRISTVLFELDGGGHPLWHHIHETSLD